MCLSAWTDFVGLSCRGYDTVFLVDDSGSMAGALWREAGKALSDVARVAAHYDDDGIDIHFLNSREFATKVKVSPPSPFHFLTRNNPRTFFRVARKFKPFSTESDPQVPHLPAHASMPSSAHTCHPSNAP